MATRRVRFVNNEGGGFATDVELSPGETVSSFLEKQLGNGFNPSSYLIRVNRDIVAADYELRTGDRVTCTPTKIEGASF